eukprot:m.8363 g.8363  ORF g.8363 m.8363 type:complete len:777 (+) comp2278_c0_seq1:3-2333(+)
MAQLILHVLGLGGRPAREYARTVLTPLRLRSARQLVRACLDVFLLQRRALLEWCDFVAGRSDHYCFDPFAKDCRCHIQGLDVHEMATWFRSSCPQANERDDQGSLPAGKCEGFGTVHGSDGDVQLSGCPDGSSCAGEPSPSRSQRELPSQPLRVPTPTMPTHTAALHDYIVASGVCAELYERIVHVLGELCADDIRDSSWSCSAQLLEDLIEDVTSLLARTAHAVACTKPDTAGAPPQTTVSPLPTISTGTGSQPAHCDPGVVHKQLRRVVSYFLLGARRIRNVAMHRCSQPSQPGQGPAAAPTSPDMLAQSVQLFALTVLDQKDTRKAIEEYIQAETSALEGTLAQYYGLSGPDIRPRSYVISFLVWRAAILARPIPLIVHVERHCHEHPGMVHGVTFEAEAAAPSTTVPAMVAGSPAGTETSSAGTSIGLSTTRASDEHQFDDPSSDIDLGGVPGVPNSFTMRLLGVATGQPASAAAHLAAVVQDAPSMYSLRGTPSGSRSLPATDPYAVGVLDKQARQEHRDRILADIISGALPLPPAATLSAVSTPPIAPLVHYVFCESRGPARIEDPLGPLETAIHVRESADAPAETEDQIESAASFNDRGAPLTTASRADGHGRTRPAWASCDCDLDEWVARMAACNLDHMCLAFAAAHIHTTPSLTASRRVSVSSLPTTPQPPSQPSPARLSAFSSTRTSPEPSGRDSTNSASGDSTRTETTQLDAGGLLGNAAWLLDVPPMAGTTREDSSLALIKHICCAVRQPADTFVWRRYDDMSQ